MPRINMDYHLCFLLFQSKRVKGNPSCLFTKRRVNMTWGFRNFCHAVIKQKTKRLQSFPGNPNCITTPHTGAKVTEFWWKGSDNLRHWEISCRGDALITSQINNASVVKLNINHIFCINYRGWLVRAPGERGWDSKGLSHPHPHFFPLSVSLSLSLFLSHSFPPLFLPLLMSLFSHFEWFFKDRDWISP